MIQKTQAEIDASAWIKAFEDLNNLPHDTKSEPIHYKEYLVQMQSRKPQHYHLPDMSKVNVPIATYVSPVPVEPNPPTVITTNEQPQIVGKVTQPLVDTVLGPAITFDAIDRKNYGDAIVDAAKVETPVPTVEVIETPIPSIEPIPVKPVEVEPTIDPLFSETITAQYQKVDTKKNKNVFYVIAVVIAIVAFFYFK